MTVRFQLNAALAAALCLVCLTSGASRAQTAPPPPDRQNPIPAPGTVTQRQAPLPAEATPKPPVVSKMVTKRVVLSASGFDLSLRQVMVGTGDWAGLVKSSGSNPERIAARIASINPQTDLFWSGHVESGATAILSQAVAHPLNLPKAGAAATLNSGQDLSLQPSLDRTGLVVVRINSDSTTLSQPLPGTVPLQLQERHNYPVSLHSGVPTAIAQTTPVDAGHVDVLILTATIDNSGK